MNELQVQDVSDEEGDLLQGAAIGNPVPGKHAFGGEDDVLAEGSESVEQRFGPGGQVFVADDIAELIENAEVKRSCVQADASVEFVLFGVVAHHGLPGLGGA